MSNLIGKTFHGTIVVADDAGGIWWPADDTAEQINGKLVLCESPDGWSLHAPGSTDDDIASGDAPYLASGAGEISDDDYRLARYELACRLCEDGAAGQWKS